MDREWCLRQGSKSDLDVVWPWLITCWPQCWSFRALPRGPLVPICSKLSSNYFLHKFGSVHTNGRKSAQIEKIFPRKTCTNCIVLFRDIRLNIVTVKSRFGTHSANLYTTSTSLNSVRHRSIWLEQSTTCAPGSRLDFWPFQTRT